LETKKDLVDRLSFYMVFKRKDFNKKGIIGYSGTMDEPDKSTELAKLVGHGL
jgi:hypothetical protein